MTVDDSNGITVVTVPARELVEYTVASLRPQLLKLLPTSPARWVLNLSQTEFVASAGIGLIVQLAHKLTSTGGKLAICTPKPEVVHLFKGPTHFLQSVPVYAQLNEAVEHLSPK